MNKEEICFKLIELYYTKKSTFNNCCMGLADLFKKYNEMLEVLKVESDDLLQILEDKEASE